MTNTELDTGPAEPSEGLLTLNDDQFIARYDPETDAEGNYYRQRDWCDPQDLALIDRAAAEGRCWTMVENDDGDPCLVEGKRLVNRLYYVVTRLPLEDPNWMVEVPYEGEKFECEHA